MIHPVTARSLKALKDQKDAVEKLISESENALAKLKAEETELNKNSIEAELTFIRTGDERKSKEINDRLFDLHGRIPVLERRIAVGNDEFIRINLEYGKASSAFHFRQSEIASSVAGGILEDVRKNKKLRASLIEAFACENVFGNTINLDGFWPGFMVNLFETPSENELRAALPKAKEMVDAAINAE